MLRHAECERYKQWKKQQDALLKGPKQKPKRKSRKDRKEVTDCIEEEKKEKPKTVLKIRYRKCTQQETQKPKQGPIFKPKPVCSVDLLFRRIQPSLEVRHKLLAHRHADCFAEDVPEIDVTVLRKATFPKTRTKITRVGTKRKRSRRRKKAKAETTEEEKVQKTEEGGEETANEEESKEKEDEAEETVEEKENVGEEGDAKAVGEKGEVKPRQKDKFWCKKLKRKVEPESEESECESICSFDSHICLKGLALTAEDKKKIKENRQQVQASSAA